jgi:hypothetical protein
LFAKVVYWQIIMDSPVGTKGSCHVPAEFAVMPSINPNNINISAKWGFGLPTLSTALKSNSSSWSFR